MAKFLDRIFRRSTDTIGQPPGTVTYVGDKKETKVRISLIDYDSTKVTGKEMENIEDCFPYTEKPTVTWINVDGIHDVEIIEKVGSCFDLHPLVQEDIVNTSQRPKIEDYEDYLYIVVKMLYFNTRTNEIKAEQVSLIVGPTYVISFQEEEGDVFNIVRDRIKKARGQIRQMGADYLAYAILDAIVDNYFTVLERIGERIENLEAELMTDPQEKTLQAIHSLKRETIFLRRSVWPMREIISAMERTRSKLISSNTFIFLRDIYDHTIQVIDSIETYRDILSGLIDLYLSSISNKMNQVMQVLTVIATIFIPLTFIVGLYGMNFDPKSSPYNMPEVVWYWGYPVVIVVMILVTIALLFYFQRKKWL
jgi:magnesium transporter